MLVHSLKSDIIKPLEKKESDRRYEEYFLAMSVSLIGQIMDELVSKLIYITILFILFYLQTTS